MLQVARLAPTLLGEAADRVAAFFEASFHPDGGARDRAGASDLYYTVFALEGLIALQREVPAATRSYLEGFGDGAELDFVHLCCLARARAAVGVRGPDLAERIAAEATPGNPYHAFLLYGALQDLGMTPRPVPIGALLPVRTTPTAAAALTLFRAQQQPVPEETVAWLLARAHPQGGFVAGEGVIVPDLLSTAVALHALAGHKVPLDAVKEPTLDLLDSLWTGEAFCGNWTDDVPDCEYTWYALLALGHLSLA